MDGQEPLLVLTRGLPGEGKSTWAAYGQATYDWKIVSLDAIRERLYGDAATQGVIEDILDEAEGELCDHLRQGFGVIFDSTGVVYDHLAPWIGIAYVYKARWAIVQWPGDVAVAKAAQAWRRSQGQRWVPDEVIDRMAAAWPAFPTLTRGRLIPVDQWTWPIGAMLPGTY